MKGSPHLLQIWLLAHIRPFCSSHPYFYITDDHSLIARLLPMFYPPEHTFSKWRQFLEELTPTQFLWVAYWNPGGPMITGCPEIIGPPLLSHLGSTLVFRSPVIRQLGGLQDIPTEADRLVYQILWADSASSVAERFSRVREMRRFCFRSRELRSGGMHKELQSIREERDRLRCELVDTRAELADYKELQRELAQTHARIANQDQEIARLSATLDRTRAKARKHARPEEDIPPTPMYSQPPTLQALPPPTPTGIPSGYSGAPSVHLSLPTVQSSFDSSDSACIATLEGMVNHLAANMATNMNELMALLRDQNRASSSYTPPPEHGPTVHPNPAVPPTLVSESEEISFSAMTYLPAVYSVTDPLPLPPAPTAVPLPPAAFLSADSAMHALPPLAMSMQPPVYTVLPLTVPTAMSASAHAYTIESFPFQTSQPHMGLSYQALPPLNIHPLEPGTPIQATPIAPPTNFLLEMERKQERRPEENRGDY
ncbi:hypothetical protein CRG98_029787 [Punica granatum]|uniref:Uncharacterized protein n=1 Tax=Punica granatum TaxID=22663 RepID=A0A2I0J1L2_PUNGR|nr:hypothetical protein CRG98_029787 [Punica granatum]